METDTFSVLCRYLFVLCSDEKFGPESVLGKLVQFYFRFLFSSGKRNSIDRLLMKTEVVHNKSVHVKKQQTTKNETTCFPFHVHAGK